MLCQHYLTLQKGSMKMKKILVVALSAVMALSLVSCSNGGDSSMSGEPSNSSVSDNLNNESSLEPSGSSDSALEPSESSGEPVLGESTPDSAPVEDSSNEVSPAAE